MAIIFHNSITKGIGSREDARAYLRSFLDEKEPELVQWLHHTWHHQGRAITYKELREMIMSGYLDQDIIEQWHHDYSVFVNKYLMPLYAKALSHAVQPIMDERTAFVFNPAAEGVLKWNETTAASFVTRCTDDQIAAIRYVVSRASQLNDMSVDELARVIRPMVGLNRPQAIANLNYYTRLIESGVSAEKAKEKSIKYSARQSRYRGHMIARTELAFAHNKGEHFGVTQAIEQGYMGQTVKIWSSAGDDRVCDTCRELDRRTHANPIEMVDHFNFQTKLKADNPDIDLTPPAHPHCLFPGNEVVAPDLIGGSIRWFEGDAITIRTASGKKITCTPNHPILTDRGWMAAGKINEGDKVIEATDIDRIMGVLEANHYNMPTPIEDIANSCLMAEGVTTHTVPITTEDFHGDGINGDVGIIYTNSLLRNNGEASGFKGIDEGKFSSGDITVGEVSLMSEGKPDKGFIRSSLTAPSGVGFFRQLPLLVGVKSTHSNEVCLASVSEKNTIISEDSIDSGSLKTQPLGESQNGLSSHIGRHNITPDSGMPHAKHILGMDWGVVDPVGSKPIIQGTFVDAEPFRNLLDGESGIIKASGVVEVTRKFVTNHVYNLQTKQSVYFSDGIITHNCRCVVVYKEISPPEFASGPNAQTVLPI